MGARAGRGRTQIRTEPGVACRHSRAVAIEPCKVVEGEEVDIEPDSEEGPVKKKGKEGEEEEDEKAVVVGEDWGNIFLPKPSEVEGFEPDEVRGESWGQQQGLEWVT